MGKEYGIREKLAPVGISLKLKPVVACRNLFFFFFFFSALLKWWWFVTILSYFSFFLNTVTHNPLL